MKDVRKLEARSSDPVVHDREQKFAFELRKHWALRHRVSLTLSDRCMVDRVVGVPRKVAVTGAFVEIGGWHVPMVEVRGIHRPHFEEEEARAAR